MPFSPEDAVFVDESKAKAYILAAVAVAPNEKGMREGMLRSLLKPGQRRLHFKGERDSRRREILGVMSRMDLRGSIWVSRGLPDKIARHRCLEELTRSAANASVGSLILERDDSVVAADRRLISEVLKDYSRTSIAYHHCTPHHEPIVWVSDAIAWSYARGSDWRRRIAPIMEDRIFVL